MVQRGPSFLRQTAEDCSERLKELKHRADRGVSSRHPSKTRRQLSIRVAQAVDDYARNFGAWRNEFDKADQTENQEQLHQAKTLLDTLSASIDDIGKALDSRFKHHLFSRHK